MAIFYNYIKGCGEKATTGESWSNDKTDNAWTTLKWTDELSRENGQYNLATNNPQLYFHINPNSTEVAGKSQYSTGRILTSAAKEQEILYDLNFKNLGLQTKFQQNSDGFYITSDIFHIKKGSTTTASFSNNIEFKKSTSISSELNVQSGALKIPTEGSITTNRNLEVGGYCQAIYFNATSDKRAKENIKQATYSALDLINKLPVYTYNYKNNVEQVTGILAQDLLKAQPQELDLVSNIDATGENGDYMSIKNDKLMFVLMKAIQEQQKQIETLKAEIEKLKA